MVINDIYAVESVKLLGITIDNELKFKKHTDILSNKVDNRTNALRRIRKFIRI